MPTNNYTTILLLFGRDTQPVTASRPSPSYQTLGTINNRDFCYSFPFEKKYAYVTKDMPKQNFGLFFSDSEIAPFYKAFPFLYWDFEFNYSRVTIALTKGSGSIEYFTDCEGYYTGISSYPWNGPPGVLFSGQQLRSSFFDRNGYTGKAAVYGIDPQARYKISPANGAAPATAGAWNFYASYCLEIRGWKYGLYNGIQTKFSATYRRSHYGHFRDMLEQRLYTKSFTSNTYEGPMDTNGGINFISGSALSGESNNYLTASIYQATDVGAAYVVNPYGSGIFDREYRASQPWHDDDPRLGT